MKTFSPPKAGAAKPQPELQKLLSRPSVSTCDRDNREPGSRGGPRGENAFFDSEDRIEKYFPRGREQGPATRWNQRDSRSLPDHWSPFRLAHARVRCRPRRSTSARCASRVAKTWFDLPTSSRVLASSSRSGRCASPASPPGTNGTTPSFAPTLVCTHSPFALVCMHLPYTRHFRVPPSHSDGLLTLKMLLARRAFETRHTPQARASASPFFPSTRSAWPGGSPMSSRKFARARGDR
jgi:hypothetical protein